ncbi:hypothetical protein V500_02875 [Pseudogymnoascus sp. VKM F-4518 (FW-2643)]|nr:hypothetical protein V500_02875 [Pseudogymnoascus sp. VKM F-4518 (FW-2643)]
MAAMDDVFATLELFEASSFPSLTATSSFPHLSFATPGISPSSPPALSNNVSSSPLHPQTRHGYRIPSSPLNSGPSSTTSVAITTSRRSYVESFGAPLIITSVPAGQEVYFRPEASWRKMLVVQPPVDVLRIYQHGLSEDGAEYAGVEWLDPRKKIHPLHGLTMWDVFAEVVQKLDGRRSGGMGIQWNMWDIVESSEEDEGYYRRASQHVVVENEPKDSETLVYVDWWIDRNAPVGNSRQEVEGPELRRMAGMEIIPGQENAKRKRMSITLGRPW